MNQLSKNNGNNIGFKPRKSTAFLVVVAAFVLIGGLVLTISYFTSKADQATKNLTLVYGISCIVVSALLFVIVNLSEDVHMLTHIAERNMDTNSYILSHLQNIEDKISEKA